MPSVSVLSHTVGGRKVGSKLTAICLLRPPILQACSLVGMDEYTASSPLVTNDAARHDSTARSSDDTGVQPLVAVRGDAVPPHMVSPTGGSGRHSEALSEPSTELARPTVTPGHRRQGSRALERLTDTVAPAAAATAAAVSGAVKAVGASLPDPISLLMPSSRRANDTSSLRWWLGTLVSATAFVLGAFFAGGALSCWGSDYERGCATQAVNLPDHGVETEMKLLDSVVLLYLGLCLLGGGGGGLASRLYLLRRRAQIVARVRSGP